MSVGESIQESATPPGPLPPRPGSWRPPAAAAPAQRRTGPPLGRMLVRALDPRLTAQLREERAQFEALSGRLRTGSSIAVVGLAPNAGRSTVAALLALALARYQGPRVLAVDTGAGLYGRLARWPGGSAHAVLVALGVRAAEDAGSRPPSVGQRWLRQRLAVADVLLLGSDPSLAETPVSPAEYPAALRALARWFAVVVTDTPRLSNESVVPAAVAAADRIVVVGPDDDQGVNWIGTCLPWVNSVGKPGREVVGALVQADPGPGSGAGPGLGSAAAHVGVPLFRLPFDAALAGRGPVRWDDLAPPTADAVTALAARLVAGLRA